MISIAGQLPLGSSLDHAPHAQWPLGGLPLIVVLKRKLRWSQGKGVVSDNWSHDYLHCVLLAIIYMVKPSC